MRSRARGGAGAAGRRFAVLAVLTGALALAGVAPLAAAAPRRVDLGHGMVVAIDPDHRIFVEAVPEAGEGLWSFARRLCGDPGCVEQIATANGGARRLLAGVRYRVPFGTLRPELELEVARALFRQDRVTPRGWEHCVGDAAVTDQEGLWQIAEWFTGRGDNYRAIREFNALVDTDLSPGQRLVIPAELLRPAFRDVLPASPPPDLEYGTDGEGDFAIYRLKPGEALYSSVVVRFTGRVFASDVNALAQEIATRSGIRDVTDIPVGYPVKIPFGVLLPEFLPPDDPRRREYEQGLLASGRFSNPVTSSHLDGITVILDAGHGGQDVGTSMDGVWESLYVYDVMLRVRRLLELHTAARVVATTRDGPTFRIADRDVLPYSRGHVVLTNPVYPIADSTVGVHLRWYLANAVFGRAVEVSHDPERVIFISIHTDSLHPSLRGVMAYIPGAEWRHVGRYGKTGAVYAARKEVARDPVVSFDRRDLVKSEGLSRQLAESIISAFGKEGLAVHPYKPVREKIIRRHHAWVPAVLRYNKVPAKVLLEICNLANGGDRALLQTRSYREQVARAVVEGILAYYGDGFGGADELPVATR